MIIFTKNYFFISFNIYRLQPTLL